MKHNYKISHVSMWSYGELKHVLMCLFSKHDFYHINLIKSVVNFGNFKN